MDTEVKRQPIPLEKRNIGKRLGAIAQFIGVSLLFGIAYTQDPIYYSSENQNTKYLQGLANAGYGFLSNDWTANTIDPLPAFTTLVQWTYQLIHPEYGFYLFYILIFGAYVYSLTAIVAEVFPLRRYQTRLLLFFALLLLFHTLDIEIFDFELDEHLHYGVAEQYILGPVFQPSNFGVFLLISIYAFLKDRPYWAVACLAIAGSFHPAYFPSVAALTLSYMGILAFQERQWTRSLWVGIVSGILIFPVFAYMYFTFQDTTPELTQQAASIIVNQRIPHHSIPVLWLEDGQAYVQTILVAIALYCVWRTRLFYILIGPFIAAVALTVVQVFINNDFVAFIAPWRISVFLVPVATSILIAQFITTLANRYPTWVRQRSLLIARISFGIILSMVIVGGVEQFQKVQKADGTFGMMEHVKATKQADDLYLLRPNEKELRKFRLYTGAPIFINRKTHPYKDVEVVEWNQRVELGDEFYRKRGVGQCGMLRNELKPYNITHIVVPSDSLERSCPRLVEEYRDEYYAVLSTKRLYRPRQSRQAKTASLWTIKEITG
ncbi:MAG: DUF6798 domain-containing protein [Cyanobacteria bacterium J06627_8]